VISSVPVVFLAAALLTPRVDAHVRPGNAWTERQAESISSIRGTRVHVRQCDGLARSRVAGRPARYRHFACLAGTRLSYQPIDTVAVTYVLHPLGKYRGRHSDYVASNVRFVGHGVP
jgi:hypothetical protein